MIEIFILGVVLIAISIIIAVTLRKTTEPKPWNDFNPTYTELQPPVEQAPIVPAMTEDVDVVETTVEVKPKRRRKRGTETTEMN